MTNKYACGENWSPMVGCHGKWQKFNTSPRCILEKNEVFPGHWKAVAEGWKTGPAKTV